MEAALLNRNQTQNELIDQLNRTKIMDSQVQAPPPSTFNYSNQNFVNNSNSNQSNQAVSGADNAQTNNQSNILPMRTQSVLEKRTNSNASQMVSNNQPNQPLSNQKRAERPMSYYHDPRLDQRPVQIRERGQSSSPTNQAGPSSTAASASSNLAQVPALSSFSSHMRTNSGSQQATTGAIATKSVQPQSPAASTTYMNVLTPIFSHLATKYRAQQIPNADQSIDELRTAFLQLEQQNPGACDLFIKYLFQHLKPTATNQI